MKRIATGLAALLVGLAAVSTAAPADATDYRQVCVEGPTGWFAYTIETPEEEAAVAGLRIEPFPNSAVGCAAYGPLAPAPTIPAAEPACEPVVVTRVVRVPVKVERIVEVPVEVERIVEVSSVQTVESPALLRRVERQAATIARLKARLARR